VWKSYSTRDAAELVGLTESTIRGFVRAGLLSAPAASVPLRFSFQDILVLRQVKELLGAGVAPRRLRGELGELRRRRPDAQLSALSLAALGGHVVVREGGAAWRADSGQGVLALGGERGPAGVLADMPVRREAPAPEPVVGLTADEWFERATELEEADPEAAAEAYRRVLRLKPDSCEALINLGRLHAESGAVERAAECFRRAVELDPGDATATYNLGVVAQDMGKDDEAIALYGRALELDPSLAEAHYNLATIFDRGGDARSAIRHINEYRKLTRA
jgi:tetratricopeptide (TPR) repeat protein